MENRSQLQSMVRLKFMNIHLNTVSLINLQYLMPPTLRGRKRENPFITTSELKASYKYLNAILNLIMSCSLPGQLSTVLTPCLIKPGGLTRFINPVGVHS